MTTRQQAAKRTPKTTPPYPPCEAARTLNYPTIFCGPFSLFMLSALLMSRFSASTLQSRPSTTRTTAAASNRSSHYVDTSLLVPALPSRVVDSSRLLSSFYSPTREATP